MYHNVKPAWIADVFKDYQRWIAEGKLPYYASYTPEGRRKQYFYDTYHTRITDLYTGDGRYEFDFQTFDSAEGDVWVAGIFRVYGDEIVILQQKAYNN